jgi:hypothetical protein
MRTLSDSRKEKGLQMRLFGASKSKGAFLSRSLASLGGVLVLAATPTVARDAQPGTWLIAASSTSPAKATAGKAKNTNVRTAAASAALIHAYNDLRLGQNDQAITDLCNILRADSNDIYARRYLCYALLQTGDAKNCLTQLDILARFNRSIAFDLCMRADALENLGQIDKGVETLKAANGMAPDNDYIRDAMIRQMQSANRLLEAIAACADGYYKTKDTQARQHYLELYYQLQSEQQLASQQSQNSAAPQSTKQGASTNKNPNWVPASKDTPGD